ncbi:uncharacterized protein STEHIDRAFT_158861 [Stereum hirsutum FP-91666 SS1]|uniref:uncharacterized protein n=1 Tax=Stereum hirsutum (strain FP-91666) TaxID=721885 RepID=UPI0004449AA3|nr:uncharacterized protein STEHIDRAFT_158861 [Stereum hirsutum FP-91666 SS1]EIM85173.1 hypothetical protein STEHIDRAFT_158861 [Stereum hirsutum FP-91666 SS1]
MVHNECKLPLRAAFEFDRDKERRASAYLGSQPTLNGAIDLVEEAGYYIPSNITQCLRCSADDLLSCQVTFRAAPTTGPGPVITVYDYDVFFTKEGPGRINGYGRHFYHRE